MKMTDLDQRIAEGKLGDLANWAISKASKGAKTVDRIEPTVGDIAKPKVRMVDGKPMEVLPDGSFKPYVQVPATPKVEVPPTATPKVDAPEIPSKPSTFDQAKAFAKAHPKVAAGAGLVGAGVVRKMADPELPGVGAATIQNIHDVGDMAVSGVDRLIRGKAVDKPAAAPADAAAPASTSPRGRAPETDDSIPDVKESMSMSTLLKLTGQRPITERDSTMGIIKPKAIQTLTEGAINECGMDMMGGSSTPASLSINATAGSGEEVANMLASIMKLAGVRPVEQDMMPAQNSNMPMMKALQIMGGPDEEMPPSDPDSMNANLGADEIELDVGTDSQSDGDSSVTVRNVDTGEEHIGRDVTEPGSITVRNVDTGEEFKGKESTADEGMDQARNFKASTTPQDPTDVPKFDPNKMADMRNYIDMAQIPPGAPGDNRLPKEEPKLQESSLGLDLFKAYEAFKNQ